MIVNFALMVTWPEARSQTADPFTEIFPRLSQKIKTPFSQDEDIGHSGNSGPMREMRPTAGSSSAIVGHGNGNWMKFEANYTVDSTVFGILHEDLRDAYNHYVQTEVAKRGLFAPTSKEEIIEKASREFVPKTFAYKEGQLTELKKSVQSMTIDDNELVFEIFEHDGRKIIQPKAFTSTPEVVSANNAERYVISMDGNRLYSIDPVTLHAEKITSDTLEGFSIDDFFENSPHVFWASLPSLNPGGSHLIYYSNKSVRDGKPELTNGLWLYSFDDQTEKPILSDRDFEGGEFVAPQMYWVNDEEFVFILVGEGQTKCIKYHIAKGIKRVLHENREYSHFSNGFILARMGNNYMIYDVKNESERVFSAPDRGKEGNVPFSPGGKAAISYGQQVMILDHQTGESATYTAPVEADFTPLGWIDENVLVLSAFVEDHRTTWLLKVEEKIRGVRLTDIGVH
jgi:hypothetical protein